MRLATVIADGGRRAGIVEGDRILVTATAGLDATIVGGGAVSRADGEWLGVEEVQFDAPLRPPVVLCAGQNYQDHLDEKAPVEVTEPEFFLKAGQTIARPGAPFRLDPAVTGKLDYETELGVIIGRAGSKIQARDAAAHIFGYVVLNDLTARDRQVKRNPDASFGMALGPGKNFDGATRMADTVVTADEVEDPQSLALTTRVNGDLRQSNSTASMTFSVAEVIAYLSGLLTLQPGTVIATGTPGGTGWGMDPELGGTGLTPAGCAPGRYLSCGDVVESSIDGVGELSFWIASRRA